MKSQFSNSSLSTTALAKPGVLYFYVMTGVLSLFFVLAGFSFTYIVPMASGNFSAPWLYHLHGGMYFTWIILMISQPLLARVKNIALHRKIGTAGFILAVGMFFIGIAMALVAGKKSVLAGAGDVARPFLLIPLTDMMLFGTFIAFSLLNLKNSAAHKRLMLLATVAVLPAAFGRLFGLLAIDFQTVSGFALGFLLLESILILGIIHDLVTLKKIHPVYIWGGSAMVIVHLLRNPVSATETWISIAEKLIGQS